MAFNQHGRHILPRDLHPREGKLKITRALLVCIALITVGSTYYFYALRYDSKSAANLLHAEDAIQDEKHADKINQHPKDPVSARELQPKNPVFIKLFPKGFATTKETDFTSTSVTFSGGTKKPQTRPQQKEAEVADAKEVKKPKEENGLKVFLTQDRRGAEIGEKDDRHYEEEKAHEAAKVVENLQGVTQLPKPGRTTVSTSGKRFLTDSGSLGQNSKAGHLQNNVTVTEDRDHRMSELEQEQNLLEKEAEILEQLSEQRNAQQNQFHSKKRNPLQDKQQNTFQDGHLAAFQDQPQNNGHSHFPVEQASFTENRTIVRPVPSNIIPKDNDDYNRLEESQVVHESFRKTNSKHIDSIMDSEMERISGEIKGTFTGLITRLLDRDGNVQYRASLNGIQQRLDPNVIRDNKMVQQSTSSVQTRPIHQQQNHQNEQLINSPNWKHADYNENPWDFKQNYVPQNRNPSVRTALETAIRANGKTVNKIHNQVSDRYWRLAAEQKQNDGNDAGQGETAQGPGAENEPDMPKNIILAENVLGDGDRYYQNRLSDLIPAKLNTQGEKGWKINANRRPPYTQSSGRHNYNDNKKKHGTRLEDQLADVLHRLHNDPLLEDRFKQLKHDLSGKHGFEQDIKLQSNGRDDSNNYDTQLALVHGNDEAGGLQNDKYTTSSKPVRGISPSIYDLSQPVAESHLCRPLVLSMFSHIICTDPNKSGAQTSHLIQRGAWQERELTKFREVLSTSSSLGVVDLGAGLGVYTVVAAGDDHNVVAVEPDKEMHHLFHETMHINSLIDRVTLVTDALGERVGVGKLRHTNDQSSQLDNTENIHVDPVKLKDVGKDDVTELVRIIRLNDLLPLMTFHKAVLKMADTGNDDKVLKGARRFFSQIDVQYVLMHWMPSKYRLQCKESSVILQQYGMEPARSANGKSLYTARELENDQEFVVWRRKYQDFGKIRN